MILYLFRCTLKFECVCEADRMKEGDEQYKMNRKCLCVRIERVCERENTSSHRLGEINKEWEREREKERERERERERVVNNEGLCNRCFQ